MHNKPFSFLNCKRTNLLPPLDQIDEQSAEYQNSILSKMSKKSNLSKISKQEILARVDELDESNDNAQGANSKV